MLQGDGEPVVTCLVTIACELVLDALNELRQLLVNVSVGLALAPIRGDQITSHDVFKRVVVVEWHGRVMLANAKLTDDEERAKDTHIGTLG